LHSALVSPLPHVFLVVLVVVFAIIVIDKGATAMGVGKRAVPVALQQFAATVITAVKFGHKAAKVDKSSNLTSNPDREHSGGNEDSGSNERRDHRPSIEARKKADANVTGDLG